MNFENMSDEDTRKSVFKTILNVSSDMENWFAKQISIDKRLESIISGGSSRQSVTTTRIESKQCDSNANFEKIWPTMESTQQCSGDKSSGTEKNKPSVISENVQRIVTPMEQENTKSTDEAVQIKIDSKTPLKEVFNIIEEFSSNSKGSDFNRVVVFFNNCCQNRNKNENANSNSGGQHETANFVLPNDVQDAMKTSQAANASESCQEKGSNCSVSSTCQQESKSIQTSEERGEVKQLNTLCTNCTPLSQQPSTSRCCFSSENSAAHVQQRLCLECSRRKEIPDAIKYCFDCRRSFYTKSDPPRTTIAASVKAMEMFTKKERSLISEGDDEKPSTDNGSDDSGISLPDDFSKLVSTVLQSNKNFNFSLAELKKLGRAILHVSTSSSNSSTSSIPLKSNEKIASSSELRNESTSSVGSPATSTPVIVLPLLVRSSSLRPNFETIFEENERNISFESVAVVKKNISQETSSKSCSGDSVKSNTCTTDTIAVGPNPEKHSVTVSSDSETSATGLSTTQAGSVVSEVVCPTRKSSLITNKTVKTGPIKRVSLKLDNDIHILENSNSSERSDNSIFQERCSLVKPKHHGYSDISNVSDNVVAKNVKPMKRSLKVSKLSKDELLGHLNNIYSALYTDEVTDQVSESMSIISNQMNLSSKKVKEEIISYWIDLCDKNCSAPEKDNCEQRSIFEIIKSKIFFFMNPVRNAETKPGRVGSVSNKSGDRDQVKELIIKKYSREIIDYVADPTSSKIKRTVSAGASKKVPLPRRKKSIV